MKIHVCSILAEKVKKKEEMNPVQFDIDIPPTQHTYIHTKHVHVHGGLSTIIIADYSEALCLCTCTLWSTFQVQ